MDVNIIVADNFYNDPDSVRNFALQQDFFVKGNHPGLRSKSFINDSQKEVINNLISSASGEVTDWFLDEDNQGYTGAFQICTAMDRTWIHSDYDNMWAAVCYLTPDAPLSSGTAIYKHIDSGERYPLVKENDRQYDCYDMTKWELVDRIGNIYNRIVLYRGKFYHASLDYFGSNFQNGRLFQTFFFNTKY